MTEPQFPRLEWEPSGRDKYGPEQIAEAVYGGIRAGYRLIDCASVYLNEDQIGESLTRVMQEGVVKREELFITSKVWNDMHAEGKVHRIL